MTPIAESKQDGRELLAAVETFFHHWIVFPEQTADSVLVCALFAINTWIYQVWSSTPYLSIQAATPGAGKSTLLECIAALSRNSELVAEPTQAALYRLAESYQGWMTVCYDDAQKLGLGSAKQLLGVLLPGYRRGATVPRTVPVTDANPAGVVRFPVYWPKAFSLIGDLVDTLRQRSIVVHLERASRARCEAQGVRPYLPDLMREEAATIVPMIGRWVAQQSRDERLPWQDATWFDGREAELWSPLYSTLKLLTTDAATLKRFKMISSDLSALKTQEASYYTAAQQVEDEARDQQYGERAIMDLARVIHEGEPGITSSDAVKRMKALPDAPWRTYRGKGLSEPVLAELVARFNVRPDRLPRKRGEQQLRGYRRTAVAAASKL